MVIGVCVAACQFVDDGDDSTLIRQRHWDAALKEQLIAGITAAEARNIILSQIVYPTYDLNSRVLSAVDEVEPSQTSFIPELVTGRILIACRFDRFDKLISCDAKTELTGP